MTNVPNQRGEIVRAVITAGGPGKWYSRHGSDTVGTATGDVVVDDLAAITQIWWGSPTAGKLRLSTDGTEGMAHLLAAGGALHGKSMVMGVSRHIIRKPLSEGAAGAHYVTLSGFSDAERRALDAIGEHFRFSFVIADTDQTARSAHTPPPRHAPPPALGDPPAAPSLHDPALGAILRRRFGRGWRGVIVMPRGLAQRGLFHPPPGLEGGGGEVSMSPALAAWVSSYTPGVPAHDVAQYRALMRRAGWTPPVLTFLRCGGGWVQQRSGVDFLHALAGTSRTVTCSVRFIDRPDPHTT